MSFIIQCVGESYLDWSASVVERVLTSASISSLVQLTLKVLVMTIDALEHF